MYNIDKILEKNSVRVILFLLKYLNFWQNYLMVNLYKTNYLCAKVYFIEIYKFMRVSALFLVKINGRISKN